MLKHASTLFLGAVLLGGCGAQPGKSIVKYESSGMAHVIQAPAAGTYALYSHFAANPDVSYELKRGDSIGFSEKDGKIYSVAGDHIDELKIGFMSGYYWKQQNP